MSFFKFVASPPSTPPHKGPLSTWSFPGGAPPVSPTTLTVPKSPATPESNGKKRKETDTPPSYPPPAPPRRRNNLQPCGPKPLSDLCIQPQKYLTKGNFCKVFTSHNSSGQAIVLKVLSDERGDSHKTLRTYIERANSLYGVLTQNHFPVVSTSFFPDHHAVQSPFIHPHEKLESLPLEVQKSVTFRLMELLFANWAQGHFFTIDLKPDNFTSDGHLMDVVDDRERVSASLFTLRDFYASAKTNCFKKLGFTQADYLHLYESANSHLNASPANAWLKDFSEWSRNLAQGLNQ